MMCQHLYSSLFESSLPLPVCDKSKPASPEDLRLWGKGLALHLDSYVSLYAKRIAEKRDFVTMLNRKLSKMKLYDRETLEAQAAEMRAVAAEKDQQILERKERGEAKEILQDNEAIREMLTAEAERMLEACPTLVAASSVEAQVMGIAGYAVFEAMLIQYDDDVLFTYELGSETILRFFLSPVFPVSAEEIENTLVLKNIIDFKTYLAGYAEIIDILFTKFSGREYIFTNVSALVEYFLDVIGYTYAFSYRNFLEDLNVDMVSKIPHLQKQFEFHYFNFMSNVEHMRCAMPAFLNKNTMRMLATMVGQFNVLERHSKRRQSLDTRQEEFAHLIDDLWCKNTDLDDHKAMLTFLDQSRSKKILELCRLFGKAQTKKLVVEVLKKYGAVRGMPGYKKRIATQHFEK